MFDVQAIKKYSVCYSHKSNTVHEKILVIAMNCNLSIASKKSNKLSNKAINSVQSTLGYQLSAVNSWLSIPCSQLLAIILWPFPCFPSLANHSGAFPCLGCTKTQQGHWGECKGKRFAMCGVIALALLIWASPLGLCDRGREGLGQGNGKTQRNQMQSYRGICFIL